MTVPSIAVVKTYRNAPHPGPKSRAPPYAAQSIIPPWHPPVPPPRRSCRLSSSRRRTRSPRRPRRPPLWMRTWRRILLHRRKANQCPFLREMFVEDTVYQSGRRRLTLDFGIIALSIAHQQRRRFAVQRVGRVRVAQQLGQEDLEDVDHVEHGRPGLVDDVEADGAGAGHKRVRRNVATVWEGKRLVQL